MLGHGSGVAHTAFAARGARVCSSRSMGQHPEMELLAAAVGLCLGRVWLADDVGAVAFDDVLAAIRDARAVRVREAGGAEGVENATVAPRAIEYAATSEGCVPFEPP